MIGSSVLPNFKLSPEQRTRFEQALKKKKNAQFLLFRMLNGQYQQNITNYIDFSGAPRVFLHGNPHIDNYAVLLSGSGIIDFDRSKWGPFVWDIMRCLASFYLKFDLLTQPKVLKKINASFEEGYVTASQNSDIYFSTPSFLHSVLLKKGQDGDELKILRNNKWFKHLEEKPLPIGDAKVKNMLRLYLENRGELGLLQNYKLQRAGERIGSLGKWHLVLFLKRKNDSNLDGILLDLKETYHEASDQVFTNPYKEDGLRMIRASNLYAPGIEQRMAHFQYDNQSWWGREIPKVKAKIPNRLDETEILELAYVMGSQLGRGHS